MDEQQQIERRLVSMSEAQARQLVEVAADLRDARRLEACGLLMDLAFAYECAVVDDGEAS